MKPTMSGAEGARRPRHWALPLAAAGLEIMETRGLISAYVTMALKRVFLGGLLLGGRAVGSRTCCTTEGAPAMPVSLAATDPQGRPLAPLGVRHLSGLR